MTNKKSTSNQPHPTVHMLEDPASRRSDLVYGESNPSWAELFPVGLESKYEFGPQNDRIIALNSISPLFAADLYDGVLTTALQFTDSQRTDDLLAEFLPGCLHAELERSGDRYRTDLIQGLMQRVDYLLRSLLSGVAPKPRCTADEWLLHVSCWIESEIARCGTCDECDPASEHLPLTDGDDDLDEMANYLLDDVDLLELWRIPPGTRSTAEHQNEFGVDIRDYPERFYPRNKFGFSPLHIDSWFKPFYGGWEVKVALREYR